MALTHDDTGLSAVCDRGISHSLTIFAVISNLCEQTTNARCYAPNFEKLLWACPSVRKHKLGKLIFADGFLTKKTYPYFFSLNYLP